MERFKYLSLSPRINNTISISCMIRALFAEPVTHDFILSQMRIRWCNDQQEVALPCGVPKCGLWENTLHHLYTVRMSPSEVFSLYLNNVIILMCNYTWIIVESDYHCYTVDNYLIALSPVFQCCTLKNGRAWWWEKVWAGCCINTYLRIS